MTESVIDFDRLKFDCWLVEIKKNCFVDCLIDSLPTFVINLDDDSLFLGCVVQISCFKHVINCETRGVWLVCCEIAWFEVPQLRMIRTNEFTELGRSRTFALVNCCEMLFPIDLNHIMNQIFSDWIVRWWNFVNFNTKETLMLNWMGNWLVNEWLWMLLGCWCQPQKGATLLVEFLHISTDKLTG